MFSCYLLQTDEGKIQPGYEDLVLNVTDNFTTLGQSPGSSIIILDVSLTIKNEFKCEVLLKNHQYCVDTTRIQFQGKLQQCFDVYVTAK